MPGAPQIAADSSGMAGIGALTQNGAGGSPAVGPSAGVPGAGVDAVNQQLMQAVNGIRQLGAASQQLASQFPALAPQMQQIQDLLKQAAVAVAQQAPQQTGSGLAIPMAGA